MFVLSATALAGTKDRVKAVYVVRGNTKRYVQDLCALIRGASSRLRTGVAGAAGPAGAGAAAGAVAGAPRSYRAAVPRNFILFAGPKHRI